MSMYSYLYQFVTMFEWKNVYAFKYIKNYLSFHFLMLA